MSNRARDSGSGNLRGRPFMPMYAITALALLAIAATLVPLIRRSDWWVRVFDFPRLQIAALMAPVIIAFIVTMNPSHPAHLALLGALLICGGYQARRILPYTPIAPVQMQPAARHAPDGGAALSILIANVLMTNRRAEGLLEQIRKTDPDLVLVLESDAWWEEQLAPLERTHPHCLKHARDDTYGMHFYSRRKLIDPEIRFLIDPGVPSVYTGVLLPNGHRVTLFGLHPSPPVPTESTESTERDGELLLVARDIENRGGTSVVCGDLNDVAWSATTRLFQRISGLLDPRLGRGFFSTYHARVPILRWPLDHIFASPDFTLIELRRLAGFGSDHFPILARLRYTPQAEAIHDDLDASEAERALARDKIATARGGA